jgi:hypothetical protein
MPCSAFFKIEENFDRNDVSMLNKKDESVVTEDRNADSNKVVDNRNVSLRSNTTITERDV